MTDSATLCTHGQIAPSNVVVTWPHSRFFLKLFLLFQNIFSYVFSTPAYTFGGSGVNEISNVVGTPQQLLGAPFSLQVSLLSLIFSATVFLFSYGSKSAQLLFAMRSIKAVSYCYIFILL